MASDFLVLHVAYALGPVIHRLMSPVVPRAFEASRLPLLHIKASGSCNCGRLPPSSGTRVPQSGANAVGECALPITENRSSGRDATTAAKRRPPIIDSVRYASAEELCGRVPTGGTRLVGGERRAKKRNVIRCRPGISIVREDSRAATYWQSHFDCRLLGRRRLLLMESVHQIVLATLRALGLACGRQLIFVFP